MLQNMTEGAPLKLIIPFMVPLLIGNVFQQLYNIADIVIVGRTIGVNALAYNYCMIREQESERWED